MRERGAADTDEPPVGVPPVDSDAGHRYGCGPRRRGAARGDTRAEGMRMATQARALSVRDETAAANERFMAAFLRGDARGVPA